MKNIRKKVIGASIAVVISLLFILGINASTIADNFATIANKDTHTALGSSGGVSVGGTIPAAYNYGLVRMGNSDVTYSGAVSIPSNVKSAWASEGDDYANEVNGLHGTPTLATNAIKGTYSALYKKVDVYKGELIDVKITVEDFETNSSYGDSDHQSYILFVKENMGVSVGEIKWIKVRCDFYKSDTNQAISIKGNTTYWDVDADQGVLLNNNNKGIYIKNNNELKADTIGGAKYVYDTSGVNQDNGIINYAFTETFEGASITRTFNFYDHDGSADGWIYFSSQHFVKATPDKPIKKVNKTEVGLGESFQYTIEQEVPNAVPDNYYSSFSIVDTLPDCLTASASNVTITNERNTNVTSNFNIGVSGQKITITPKNLNAASFYGHEYSVKITTSTKSGYDMTPYKQGNVYKITNKATVTTDGTPQNTEEVVVTAKIPVTVTYHVLGDVKPPASQTDPTPAVEHKYAGDSYTAKAGLTTTYQEKKCTFNGWYSNSGLTGNKYTSGTLTSNLDLYGKWTCIDPIKVTYHVSGRDSDNFIPPASVTLPSTVTLNSSGAPIETGRYFPGDSYTAKPTLSTASSYTAKKCTFIGWYSNSGLTTKYTTGNPTKDLDLYGKWDCKDPVAIKYNIVSTDNPPVSTININKAKPDDVPVGTYYEDDNYTAAGKLTTTWRKKKCTFTGWTTDTGLKTAWTSPGKLSANKLTAAANNKVLNLYGGWACEELVRPAIKLVNDKNLIEIQKDERFTFTISHEVPNITDSYYYYDKYVFTDQIEPVLKIREVDITDKNGNDVTNKFRIVIEDSTVTITAKYTNVASFYNQKYYYTIIAHKKDGVNLNSYLQSNGQYEIPNKAGIEVNEAEIDKTKIETNEVKIRVKQYDIKYHIVGEVAPPQDQTDPMPADQRVLSGSKYTQAAKLTTRYKEKKCTFNGWYLDKALTKKWKNNDEVYEDLNFYGSWQCDNIVNDINKTATTDKIIGTKDFKYTIYQVVPDLTEEFYYKSYEITDQLEQVLEIKGKEAVKIKAGDTDVTANFDITVENNLVTITAKDTTKAEFYNKEYAFELTVNRKKDADLTPYKKGDTYIIPNQAKLKVEKAESTETEPVIEEKESPVVEKEIGKVTIKYRVIGDVFPDPAQTDPVPGEETILAGEQYTAKPGLTTRYTGQKCTFIGWYIDRDLKTKYQDKSEVNEDLDLYGKWDCNEVVAVPKTSAFISKIFLGFGALLLAAAAAAMYFVFKKKNLKHS